MSIAVNVITSIDRRLQVWVIAQLPVSLLFFVSTRMQPPIATHATSSTTKRDRERESERVRGKKIPRSTLAMVSLPSIKNRSRQDAIFAFSRYFLSRGGGNATEDPPLLIREHGALGWRKTRANYALAYVACVHCAALENVRGTVFNLDDPLWWTRSLD